VNNIKRRQERKKSLISRPSNAVCCFVSFSVLFLSCIYVRRWRRRLISWVSNVFLCFCTFYMLVVLFHFLSAWVSNVFYMFVLFYMPVVLLYCICVSCSFCAMCWLLVFYSFSDGVFYVFLFEWKLCDIIVHEIVILSLYSFLMFIIFF
jgi:hypothetical protein